MKIIQGNLLALAESGQFDIIAHGANCFHVMGAGIAAQIKERYPEAYEADLGTEYGNISKLGGYSYAQVTRNGVSFTVVNAYTQFMTGPMARLEAVEQSMRSVAALARPTGRVGVPAIGCGIGGLEMENVQMVFDKVFKGVDATLVLYKP